MNCQWIIFTDLDGTLLDRNSYSFNEALPALNMIREHAIPLILNSSKTSAEIESLRTQLNNHDPFVCENGAAVMIPEGCFEVADVGERSEDGRFLIKRFSEPYEHILEVLAEARRCGFQFQSFSDWSAAELARRTGLPEDKAALAKQRMGSEPLLFTGDLAGFRQFLMAFRLRALQGGRFLHIMGQYDKSDGLQWLKAAYREKFAPSPLYTIALGDSHNDEGMLSAVDCPIVIRSPHSSDIRLPPARTVYYSHAQGAEGWNEVMLPMLRHRFAGLTREPCTAVANPDP